MAMVRSTPCQNVILPRRAPTRGRRRRRRRAPTRRDTRGGRDRPDGEPPHVAAHERDRPREREPRGQGAEGEHPGPARLEAEELVVNALAASDMTYSSNTAQPRFWGDVQAGGRVRPAVPERVAHEHHPGNPPLEADQPGKAEERRPQHGADDRREERALQPQPGQERPREEDEQADAEIPQSSPTSSSESVRSRSGTGVMPHERSDGSIVPPSLALPRSGSAGRGSRAPLSR